MMFVVLTINNHRDSFADGWRNSILKVRTAIRLVCVCEHFACLPTQCKDMRRTDASRWTESAASTRRTCRLQWRMMLKVYVNFKSFRNGFHRATHIPCCRCSRASIALRASKIPSALKRFGSTGCQTIHWTHQATQSLCKRESRFRTLELLCRGW